jgi:hypothetical protein
MRRRRKREAKNNDQRQYFFHLNLPPSRFLLHSAGRLDTEPLEKMKITDSSAKRLPGPPDTIQAQSRAACPMEHAKWRARKRKGA